VLRGLKIRSETDHPIVFFAEFDELNPLNLDECSVQVLVADIDTAGMFFIKYTREGLLRAHIVLSCKLYNNPKTVIKEQRKIAGVHEFVHFLAVVYVATATGSASLRSRLLSRLQRTVEKLPEENLLALYTALTNKITAEKTSAELTDTHFRLDYEGPTPDYKLLFLHLMFSRELFETYFNTEKQIQFKNLVAKNDNGRAIRLLDTALNEAAQDKDIPVTMALNQLLDWVYVYTRE
jgi:hypothetical protein